MKEKINRLIGLGLLFLMLWGGMMVWKQFGGITNPESMTLDTSFQHWFLATTQPGSRNSGRTDICRRIGDRHSPSRTER